MVARKHRSLCTKLLDHLVPMVVTRRVFGTAAEVLNVTPPCQLLSRITTHDLFSLIRIFFISALCACRAVGDSRRRNASVATVSLRIINNRLLIISTRNSCLFVVARRSSRNLCLTDLGVNIACGKISSYLEDWRNSCRCFLEVIYELKVFFLFLFCFFLWLHSISEIASSWLYENVDEKVDICRSVYFENKRNNPGNLKTRTASTRSDVSKRTTHEIRICPDEFEFFPSGERKV